LGLAALEAPQEVKRHQAAIQFFQPSLQTAVAVAEVWGSLESTEALAVAAAAWIQEAALPQAAQVFRVKATPEAAGKVMIAVVGTTLIQVAAVAGGPEAVTAYKTPALGLVAMALSPLLPAQHSTMQAAAADRAIADTRLLLRVLAVLVAEEMAALAAVTDRPEV
jgi:hypothetical protein